jgi:chaperonin GroES
MECPISPLSDKIIILPNDEGEQMYGNIVVPDMGKEKPEIGKVLAVGPGRITPDGNLVPNQIQVGQTVLVPKFGAQTMTVENETYIMASENYALGTLNKKENDNE